jgi:uncharacterized lipoprotein YddW (UPF0748 family)
LVLLILAACQQADSTPDALPSDDVAVQDPGAPDPGSADGRPEAAEEASEAEAADGAGPDEGNLDGVDDNVPDITDASAPDVAPEATDASPDESGAPPTPKEIRALWVNRWAFSSASDVAEIMDAAADAGFTVVYFQVRGRFDAYYPSTLEPWAKELTGTLGKDPGWDPLGTALAEAHANGLELHAWINVFSLWSGSGAPASVGLPHPLTTHPDWRMVDVDGVPMPLGSPEYQWASPGIAAVRAWNTAVAEEIVALYPDLDGLHLDRIRYPGPDYSYDAESLAGWSAAKATEPGLTFAAYRARQVDAQVAGIHAMLQGLAPQVTLSAAVAAIYQDVWGWGGVSLGLADHFQDTLAWLDAGTIDVVCPMAYWPLTTPKGEWTDLASIADFWLTDPARRQHVVLGLSADYDSFGEIDAEIAYVRGLEGAGVALYDWAALVNHDHLGALASGPFAEAP